MNLSKCGRRILAAAICWIVCTGFVCADNGLADANEKPILSKSDSIADTGKDIDMTDDSIGQALRRMIIAVVIVILLGVAAMVATKKILPGFSQMQGKKIKVVETIHLGNRKSVHLLEIGDQQILVGSTSDRITKLADIYSEKGFPLKQAEGSEVSE